MYACCKKETGGDGGNGITVTHDHLPMRGVGIRSTTAWRFVLGCRVERHYRRAGSERTAAALATDRAHQNHTHARQKHIPPLSHSCVRKRTDYQPVRERYFSGTEQGADDEKIARVTDRRSRVCGA